MSRIPVVERLRLRVAFDSVFSPLLGLALFYRVDRSVIILFPTIPARHSSSPPNYQQHRESIIISSAHSSRGLSLSAN